jgi:translation initiation factor IF-2
VITQTAPPAQKPPGAARRERERQKERDRERERLAKLELAATPGGKVGETGATATMTPVLTGPVRIDQPLTVGELSKLLMRRETEIIKHLFMKGVMVTVNQTLEAAYGRTIAKELGAEVDETEVSTDKNGTGEYTSGLLDKKPEGQAEEAQDEGLVLRPPVVSIMGHVDHGKTSLLDAIRETRQKIVDSEAGGITQSIGAYTVEKNDQTIVFLDTPGHEAFTSMRMRGAQATDIAILVVAADDGVMPQTIEAISHAKAAGIPIIVAVNKIDKAGADPEKVLVQLSDHGLVSEKWGGETVTVEVSALQKLGLDDLLEMILLVAELQNLKANPGKPAEGVIIEAQLDKRKGPVATALVQSGTLRVGDYVLMGPVGGRVRALLNDYGQRVKLAGPSTPVEILGLGEVPKAGDAFEAVPDERVFKQRLTTARDKEREERLSQGVAGRTQGFALVEGSGPESKKSFNLIVKADTQGSSEAVNAAILQLSTDEIQVKIIHSGTGDISEADVMLATASQAMILAFNVKADLNAARVAEENTIRIEHFDVIYHLTEAIQKWMLGQLSPTVEEVEAGVAEVRQLFTVGKATVIAGCMVTKGKMIRNAKARVSRNGQELFAGPLDNLKRFKDDAKEVATGYECGISFSKFNDLQEGDLITVYTVEETARTSL